MPFATHRGQKIHYTVEGRGPLVVLQHGLFMDAESWRANGFVAALADRFTVACVDSLGHGLSDKPTDPALYAQDQRAGDIVAVLDALSAEKAHLVGYSMGGWMAVGVARYYPRRLASLTIGGWDLANGVPKGPSGPIRFDIFWGFSQQVAPALVSWVTPEILPGVQAAFEALNTLDGAAEAVLGAGAPVLLWDGTADPYHAPSQAFAAAHGLPFLSTPGDHLQAIMTPAPDVVVRLGEFFAEA
ncbi:alpha/beta fold hydrolase [Caulobacter endophyticus]|uniref:Alpha/beta hydrolase n=1 Tax=Caulobacter endophyticus TaxID=2172652 RepID=A0A2T9JS02_9CAUL|nr:alpha/beta hydrolase [Caulobacter endophyticus]PVM86468.1 alpha/beta hydrolase [Caulobacter endophyticus]